MISKAKATDNLLLPLLSFWNPSCRISTFLLVWYRILLQFLLALTCTPSISALRYLSKQSDRKLSEQTREFDPTSSLSSHKRTIHSLNPLGLKGNKKTSLPSTLTTETMQVIAVVIKSRNTLCLTLRALVDKGDFYRDSSLKCNKNICTGYIQSRQHVPHIRSAPSTVTNIDLQPQLPVRERSVVRCWG